MEINIVFQIAAVGILVAVLNQVLVRAGREEQAMMTTLAGLVVVLFWVIQYISRLFETVQDFIPSIKQGDFMEILQITAVGISAAVLSICIKKYNPELSLLIGLLTGVLIFLFIADTLAEIIQILRLMAEDTGIGNHYLSVVLKVIGIAYIAEFGMQLCADAGANSISSKIELAGKILILSVSAPVITALMRTVMGLL